MEDGISWFADIGLFALWCATGLTAGAVLAGAFTIGIFFAPAAWLFMALSVWRTARRPGRIHTMAGLLMGPAVALGFLSRTLPLVLAGTAILALAAVTLIVGHRRNATTCRPRQR